jgi:hypothetical protein
LFRYSVTGDSFVELTQYNHKIFLNFDGKKKKFKDGAGMVYYDNALYLLKGGNTQEFWYYDIARDSYIQMGPADQWNIPEGGSKRVKAGGCLTLLDEIFYVVKGANTQEFYAHGVPTLFDMKVSTTTENVTGRKVAAGEFNLTIAPNPAINLTAIRYTLPKPGPVSFKLYNVMGEMVKSYANTNPTKDGVLMIDAKVLSSGVYILRFNSGDIRITRKLVLEK